MKALLLAVLALAAFAPTAVAQDPYEMTREQYLATYTRERMGDDNFPWRINNVPPRPDIRTIDPRIVLNGALDYAEHHEDIALAAYRAMATGDTTYRPLLRELVGRYEHDFNMALMFTRALEGLGQPVGFAADLYRRRS